ncbi:MAG TPA: hypothetical protein VGB55_12525 [Tepidisphaeraceae bacterium]
MSNGARVNDVEAIGRFRAALIKFMEAGNVALADSEGDVVRKLMWLESEQDSFWVSQVRKWTEAVDKAKDAVRQKRIFKDGLGRQQSVVDEEKHLRRCQAVLAEAETKLANTRKYARQLQRDHLLYRGGVQRLSTMISSDLPKAVAMLDTVTTKLDAYFAAAPTLAGSEAGPAQGVLRHETEGPAVKRAAAEEPEADNEATTDKLAEDKEHGTA